MKRWQVATFLILLVVSIILWKKKKEMFEEDGESLYISIVTMRKYKEAMDNLLESLPEGFNKYILIYQGEDTDYYERKDDGHYEVYLKRNIYEYGAWEGLYMLKQDGILKESDYVLMLHDTCKTGGENTLRLAKDIISKNKEFEIFWASDFGQCNICIINSSVIDKIRELYKDTHTLDKGEAISMEWNHTHEKSIKKLKDSTKQIFDNEPTENRGTRKVYSTGTDRLCVYLKCIDVEKYFVNLSNTGKTHPGTL
jgi:hypothetical protein